MAVQVLAGRQVFETHQVAAPDGFTGAKVLCLPVRARDPP